MDLFSGSEEIAPPTNGYRVPPCPLQEIKTLYHQTLPTLEQMRFSTRTWDAHIRNRWREVCVEEQCDSRAALRFFEDYFLIVKARPFLLGKNDRGWRANLAWLMNPTNFAKVLNGGYQR